MILTDARVEQGAQFMSASGLGVDPAAKKAWLTNGLSTLEPAPVFRVIGPKVTETMAPYHFGQPPTVHASGVIPLSEENDVADLHFTVDGGPFNWLRFNLDHVSGGVDWVGNRLSLTNVQGAFYQGSLAASAQFDFSPHEGADFSFDTKVIDTDLHALIADLSPGTNHLEGRLTGELNITDANTTDTQSWNGGGQVELRNGLLWDVPIFGIFSPVLDAFQKGWGQSRADRGSATFSITNSVIYSDDLQLHAPAIEMWYQGRVDFKGRVDATVQARLLRETPLFGPMLDLALLPFTKLFEYQVTGTLSEPKSEPRVQGHPAPADAIQPRPVPPAIDARRPVAGYQRPSAAEAIPVSPFTIGIEFARATARLEPMRWLMLGLLLFLPTAAKAADNRICKVLPQYLDEKGRESLTPSLYDRDAYQAYLRLNPAKRSALRFAVQWKATVTQTNQWKLRVEVRGALQDTVSKQTTLEMPLPVHHRFSRWDYLVMSGDQYKTFGEVTAWRVTLWDGDQMIDEEKSFLW